MAEPIKVLFFLIFKCIKCIFFVFVNTSKAMTKVRTKIGQIDNASEYHALNR